MDARARLIDWIRVHGVDAETVDAATPFLAEGHLNSIQLTDFILFVEEVSGRPLLLDHLKPDNFANVDAVCAAFFGEDT